MYLVHIIIETMQRITPAEFHNLAFPVKDPYFFFGGF
jgi:hypothetical protein